MENKNKQILFEKIRKYDVAIYGNTGVIQYIKMIPEVTMEGES